MRVLNQKIYLPVKSEFYSIANYNFNHNFGLEIKLYSKNES
jgi:hypothetical protein